VSLQITDCKDEETQKRGMVCIVYYYMGQFNDKFNNALKNKRVSALGIDLKGWYEVIWQRGRIFHNHPGNIWM
jgi:hypothetical protein